MQKGLLDGIKRGETVLEARGITKRFPGVVANDHIDFEIRAGEIHAWNARNSALGSRESPLPLTPSQARQISRER